MARFLLSSLVVYGETSGQASFSENLPEYFGSNQANVRLVSISVLNPVGLDSFLALDVKTKKGLLQFKAEHDNQSVGGMNWTMDTDSQNSPLNGFRFLGGSTVHKGYDANPNVVTLPIYDANFSFGRDRYAKGEIKVTLDQALVSRFTER